MRSSYLYSGIDLAPKLSIRLTVPQTIDNLQHKYKIIYEAK
jgi:hypothetical protein